MLRFISCLPALCLCAGAFAGTIIFTDSAHPISTLSSNIPVVYLDAPDHLQSELFGSLPADAVQAKKAGPWNTRFT